MSNWTPIAILPNFSAPPAAWQWKRLGDVARLESGHTPSRARADWWGGDVSWISLTEIRALDGRWTEETQIKTNQDGLANSAARILPRGTVCFSRTASVGFVTIMAKPMATSQDFANWVCSDALDPEFLMYALISSRETLRELASGATHKTIYMPTLAEFHICMPARREQETVVARLKGQMTAIESATIAAGAQREELTRLVNAIVFQSLSAPHTQSTSLGNVLREVKQGIGSAWTRYPVLGATRDGLALAKEPVGKYPERYKPVGAGTVFYNPMRILIGSIAMVDEGDPEGITSPDYVVLRGRDGLVDSRWLYFWLRSPDGANCIARLARGAVRERMLFNRLAEGKIDLPPYEAQIKASQHLAAIRGLWAPIKSRLADLQSLPGRFLAQAFTNI